MLLYDAHSIAHPRTILLPSRNGAEDVTEMVTQPNWQMIEEMIGFPCILKPVDGYAWQDVFKVPDCATLRGLYDSLKARRTLIVQQLMMFVGYYRAFCVRARDVLIVRWTPKPFDQGEYAIPGPNELGDAEAHIRQKTIDLNEAYGLDFNAVEWCLTKDGTPVIIDSYNDVPDVRREKLPAAAFSWVVDRFCACVKERLSDCESNKIMRRVQPSSNSGTPSG
jgi:hypothetical protein